MHHRTGGNVLFLILIAVALFAALSYVVLGSSRTGGGSAGKERAELEAAALLHYPLAIKTAVMRMVLDGKDVHNIRTLFEYHPGHSLWSQIQGLDSEYLNNLVFHPQGGGVAYQEIPKDVFLENSDTAPYPRNWLWFNVETHIPGVGSEEPEEIIMLYGIKPEICAALNKKAGIYYSTNGSAECNISSAAPVIGVCGDNSWCSTYSSGCEHVIDGHPVFCAKLLQNADVYAIVYTLLER